MFLHCSINDNCSQKTAMIYSVLVNKRLIVVLVGCIVLFGFLGGLYFLSTTQANKVVSPSSIEEKKEVVKMVSKTMREHTDAAGFVFQYPDNLDLKTVATTDKTIYSSLLITSKDTSGNIEISVADTKNKTFEDFVKENKIATQGAQISEKALGKLKAHEIKSAKDTIIIAIDQGILFVIKSNYGNNGVFWEPAQQAIVSSFTFSAPEQQAGSQTTATSGDEIFFEGEETIE